MSTIIQPPYIFPSVGMTRNIDSQFALYSLISVLQGYNDGTNTWDSVSVGTASSITGNLNFYSSSSAFKASISSASQSANRTWTIPNISGNGTFAALEGTQTFTGLKSFSSAINITATSNHLVLSTSSNSLTINANAQATSARTWSVPDISGSGTFAALEGTQTFSGTKTFSAQLSLTTSGSNNSLVIGGLTPGGHVYGSILARAFVTGATNGHGFGDESTFGSNAATAYASYDASAKTVGSNNYSHIIAFQGNNAHTSSGTLDNFYGFLTDCTNNGGTITTRWGYVVDEATGSGAITTQYGLYIDSLTKATTNYAIYTNGSTVSRFGGQIVSAATSNHLKLATASNNAIISVASIATADRTITIPDPGTAANFVLSEANATINGIKTFAGQLIGKGTATNDSAASGNIGEYMEVKNSTFANTAATGTVAEIDHLALTAGDWDVSATVIYNRNGATFSTTDLEIFISTASGTGTTGIANAESYVYQIGVAPTSFTSVTLHIPRFRISLSGSTTYYLKQLIDHYTVGNPQLTYIFNARRAR